MQTINTAKNLVANLQQADSQQAGSQQTGQPVVGTWSFPRDPGLTVGGTSKITLTNGSDTGLRVLFDGGEADLPARGLLTLPLKLGVDNLIRFEAPNGGEAEGFFVLHNTESRWRVPGVRVEVKTPFQGPIGLALVSQPSSGFVVEWIADEGVQARVAPGEVAVRFFTDVEARSMALLGLDNVTGQGTAQGIFCGL